LREYDIFDKEHGKQEFCRIKERIFFNKQ